MKNIIFERRYREMPLNRGSVPQQRLALERLPEFAAELVRLNVDVIVATGTLAPLAAKLATTTIPRPCDVSKPLQRACCMPVRRCSSSSRLLQFTAGGARRES